MYQSSTPLQEESSEDSWNLVEARKHKPNWQLHR
jgi:hypothetical protein